MKEYPVCPEAIAHYAEWFSEFKTDLAEKHGIVNKSGKYQGPAKLIPHLHRHEKYVIHYRNWEFIEQLGARIIKLYRVISFKHKAWVLPYIEFNHEKKAAKSDVEKDLPSC